MLTMTPFAVTLEVLLTAMPATSAKLIPLLKFSPCGHATANPPACAWVVGPTENGIAHAPYGAVPPVAVEVTELMVL